jgi:hypothetical protein
MPSIKPLHEHDCDCCEYHGQVASHAMLLDVYFCPQSDNGTVIARYGVDGDYFSMPAELIKNNQLSSSILFKAYELVNARKERAKTHSLSTGHKLGPLAPLL